MPMHDLSTISTEQDLALARQTLPVDQAREVAIGCETWGITYGRASERGQMTVWPGGRGAVCWGGNSLWGEWDTNRRILTLDEPDDDGWTVEVDEDGVAETKAY